MTVTDVELTDAEVAILDQLGEVFNLFVGLPVMHRSDADEFTNAIHVAQNIVLARVALRLMQHQRPSGDWR